MMESRKDAPMPMPIMAMISVRLSGRVRSAASARVTPAIAPHPCRARPAMSQPMPGASAATTPPMMKSSSPMKMMRRRPQRSDIQPKGCCSIACVRP